MAEGRGDVDSSDDSISDEESWALHFDLPDNDQTWLFCPSGVDPMSRVDLTEIFTASQRFGNKLSSQQFLNELSNTTTKEARGESFDSRTFTRPKKQIPNLFNPGSSLTSLQRSKLTQIFPECNNEGNNSLKFSKKPLLNKSASVETLIFDEDIVPPSSSFLSNTKQNNYSFIFQNCSLIINTSCPKSFQNISHLEDNSGLMESIYQTGISSLTQNSSNENKIKNNRSSNKDSISSLIKSESHLSWSTPPDVFSSKMLFFDPITVSTPLTSQVDKTTKNIDCFMKNTNVNNNINGIKVDSKNEIYLVKTEDTKNETYLVKTEDIKNETYHIQTEDINDETSNLKKIDTFCMPRHYSLKTDRYNSNEGAEPFEYPMTVSASQRNVKEEDVISKSKKVHVSSHSYRILTEKSGRKFNETFSFKEDDNDSKKNNSLYSCDRTLLENISCPSEFMSDLSLNNINLTTRQDGPINECERDVQEVNSKCLKSIPSKDDSLTKDSNPVSKNVLSSPSEKYSKKSTGFDFRPALVSTPKTLELKHSKEPDVNSSANAINDLCYANNNTLINPNEQCKSNSILNTTITLNDNVPNIQEQNDTNTLIDPDKDNANYLTDNVYGSYKTTSVESVNKNLKINKEKDEDSASDSCYSSSSNIRSIGDVCGMVQQHDNLNLPTSMRKSISHDSLLSQETYKAPSTFHKHESMLNLTPNRGGQRIDKVIPDAKIFGTSSKLVRGGRTLCKPKFSVRNSDFENINPNETFRVDKQHEGQAAGPSVARPSFTSKLPVLSQRKRIPKPQFRMDKPQ